MLLSPNPNTSSSLNYSTSSKPNPEKTGHIKCTLPLVVCSEDSSLLLAGEEDPWLCNFKRNGEL